MEYPVEVQNKIDVLNTYTENPELTCADIYHLYPKELAYPDGYFDSRFFTLVCFNTKTNEKRIIEYRDGLDFPLDNGMLLRLIRIFADGSTIIVFRKAYDFNIFQSVSIGKDFI
jgi:hypothetical protein